MRNNGAKVTLSKMTLVFVLVVLSGIYLRFRNIELQEFYLDEAATLTNVTGHRVRSLEHELERKGWLRAAEVIQYQKLQPHLKIGYSLFELARGDPLHPPLYYLICRLWVEAFGDSVASVRSLSIIFGLLLLGAIWRLLLVLFRSKQIAFLGVALSIVSPFLFIVSTSAREYSLWLLLVTLATTEFIQRHWLRYIFFSLLSLYTSLFTLPLILGHLAHYLYERKGKFSYRPNRWAVAGALVALTLCFPWISIIVEHWPGAWRFAWMGETVPLWQYVSGVCSSLYKIFFDFDVRKDSDFTLILIAAPIAIGVVLLEIFAFRALFKDSATRPIAIFFLFLIVATILPTLGLDILLGGKRGLSPRYHLFAFVIIHMTVVYYLSKMMLSENLAAKRTGRVAICLLLVAGLASQFHMSSSETWWNKYYESSAYDISRQFKHSSEALLVSKDTYHLIAISRYLPPNVRLTLTWVLKRNYGPLNWKRVFFFRLSDQEIRHFEEQNQVSAKLIKGVWRMEPAQLP